MSNHNLKSQFDRDGYIVVRQFLPPDDLAELTGELDRYIRDVVPTLPPADAFYQVRTRPETLKQLQHMTGDPFFAAYSDHERWRNLAEELVGETCECLGPEWFNKPPGAEHPTPPHQDNFYFCQRPSHVVTLWMALDHIDDANGCLRYVTGSHLRGIRPHNPTKVLGFSQGIIDFGPDDEAQEVAMHLEPGDLIAHHGETIHRADANRSADRHRRAFAMVLKGRSCQRDEDAYARYLAALDVQHATV